MQARVTNGSIVFTQPFSIPQLCVCTSLVPFGATNYVGTEVCMQVRATVQE